MLLHYITLCFDAVVFLFVSHYYLMVKINNNILNINYLTFKNILFIIKFICVFILYSVIIYFFPLYIFIILITCFSLLFLVFIFIILDDTLMTVGEDPFPCAIKYFNETFVKYFLEIKSNYIETVQKFKKKWKEIKFHNEG
jgi:hypothetical protein